MFLKKGFLFFSLLFLLVSCAGVKVLGPKIDLYSELFLKNINEIKSHYREGNKELALGELKKIDEAHLNGPEKALKRNLMGVIYFSMEQFEQAIFHFELALSSSQEDEFLLNQLYLNLGSSYFKLEKFEKAFEVLAKAKFENMRENEFMKYHKLNFKLAQDLGKRSAAVTSLLWMLERKKGLNDLKSDPYFEILYSEFIRLSASERQAILDPFIGKKFSAFYKMFYIHAEKLYYEGEREKAQDLLEWMEKEFVEDKEIVNVVHGFLFRINNYSRIIQENIGLILPLSGGKKKFGERALMGVETAFALSKEKKDSLKLLIKDSQGSGALGAYRVKELVEKNSVSVIIGGLFSGEAEREYLEAKKYGVLFISLSQVFLPKEKKDHLILEIPGSVESQIEKIFSPEFLSLFGKRAAILYPKDPRGESYLDAFWRYSELNDVQVNAMASFEKGQTDYRAVVKSLLGLDLARERKEEFDIYDEIYSLEKSRNIRRIQVLPPQVDFDWIFIPSYPRESLQILPAFTYFDAHKVKFIGGPSWRNTSIAQKGSKYGRVYFIGDNVESYNENFIGDFVSRNKRKPKIVEVMAFDAFKIAQSFLSQGDFSKRDEFDQKIRETKSIKASTGKWNYLKGVWIKDMAPMSVRSGRVEKISL